MQINLRILDLSGICVITRTGGDSLLCMGDLATHRPFEELMSKDYDLRMGIKCSEKAYDKAARKQSNNKVMVNHKTLLKHLNPGMFTGNLSAHTVAEVTGKKATWKNGKQISPQLTVEEELYCHIAEWAYSSLGTLRGVSVTVSLNNGVTFKKVFTV